VAFIGKPIDVADFTLTVNMHLNRTYEQKRLNHDTQFDELTGLRNRREIVNNIRTTLMQRVYRDHSLILFDIDHFKNFNDSYGHNVGDQFLALLGVNISQCLRPTDFAGRYGGDECIVFLPDTNIHGAWVVAHKLQRAIKSIKIPHEGQKLGLGASFGVVSLKTSENRIRNLGTLLPFRQVFEPSLNGTTNWDEVESAKLRISELLIELVDQELYRAKSSLCHSCNYSSLKTEAFINQQCPACGSANISHGRDRITMEDKDSPL
jgi:diguanylate cyclase (GGDEF)-like protein